jgi:hypothetical protein
MYLEENVRRSSITAERDGQARVKTNIIPHKEKNKIC